MTVRRVRAAVALVAALISLAGCTGSPPRVIVPTSPTSPNTSRGGGSGFQANPLCRRPALLPTPPSPSVGSLPPAISLVAGQVERVRQLRFERSVIPEPVSRAEIERQLHASLEAQLRADEAAREGRTWITIGALPAGTDLRRAAVDFGTSQIIGYYDTRSHRLVFQGGASPTPYERFTLAHELTHALDDQHFDLSRLDRLNDTCQDERAEAMLSLAEGDAVETQLQWAREDLSAREITALQREASSFPPPPASTPEFVRQMFLFPYPNGQAFVEALLARGGEAAVDAAFRNPPVSTEQVLHPEKYPDDRPQAVQIPDLSSRLGTGWSLLEQEDVGEGWLLMLLGLRLSTDESKAAAAGWDGGLLRSWSKGSQTAVLIQTVWDTERDAQEFAAAMAEWIGGHAAEARRTGETVRVFFGSDRATLREIEAAAA